MDDHKKGILDIVRSTREKSLPFFGNVEIAGIKNGSAVDIVTKIDVEIEEYLARELEKHDSSIEFVGEENGGNRDAERYFMVDPIDGTGHFVRGIPFCTTMLALVENGHVTFSAIYDFVNDVMYHAEKGKGAFKEDEPIHVGTRDLKSAYMFYESNRGIQKNMEIYTEVRKHVSLLSTFSAGFEFTLIATGKIEGRICITPFGKDYDFAPGTLLVQEAGGTVANLGKGTFDHRNLDFIAANPVVYKELTDGPDALFPILE